MSSPKFTRIVRELERRLLVITQQNGFYTDIGRRIYFDMRSPQREEVPCSMIFAEQRAVESTSGCNDRVSMNLFVFGYVEATDAPLILGDQIQSDIQRAIELEDSSLGGLLRRQYGLSFLTSEIFMPEPGADVVGARVSYSAPHIRVYGDPEIE